MTDNDPLTELMLGFQSQIQSLQQQVGSLTQQVLSHERTIVELTRRLDKRDMDDKFASMQMGRW